ncbi:MAG: type I 3-dehydroquinate dehydratase [Candidatus Roizmanbacteria bacterium]
MKSPLICAAVAAQTVDELIHRANIAAAHADLVELRLDHLVNQSSFHLEQLKNVSKKKCIITCRRRDEGGRWTESEEKRLAVFADAYRMGYAYIDIELRTLEERQCAIPIKSRSKTIVSYHDFDHTPGLDELVNISRRMDVFHPQIRKIATMVRCEEDIHTLYTLLVNNRESDAYCIIGMGALGKQTRIIAPLLGGVLTYGSLDHEADTAPGQMTCAEMKTIYTLLL